MAERGDPPDRVRRWDSSIILEDTDQSGRAFTQLEVPSGRPADTGRSRLGGRCFLVQPVRADRVQMETQSQRRGDAEGT